MKFREYIVQHHRWIVFGLIPLLSLAMHLHIIPLEIRGVHAWRQAETTANIVNFAEDDFNILNPHVNSLEWEGGLKRMEFPLMQWVMAGFYKVFGPHIAIVRLLSLLISLFSVWGMFRLGQHLFRDNFGATVLAWCMAWSPAFFYYAVNPLPDNFSMMCGIWGWAFFLRWYRQKKSLDLWWSALFLMLSALTKLPFILFYGIPLSYAFWDTLKTRFRSLVPNLKLVLPAVLSLAAPAAWYLTVIPTWTGNGVVGGILHASADEAAEIWTIFTMNIVSTLPELLLNYGAVIFFLWGIALFFYARAWKSALTPAFLTLAAGVMAYYLFEINMISTVHDYYLFPFLPGLFLFVAYGADCMSRMPQKGLRILTLVALLVLPLLAGLRAYPRWKTHVSEELFTQRAELREAVPESAKVLVGDDLSPHIYLYHLHKKGWNISRKEAIHPNRMAYCLSNGAEYFYCDDRELEQHPMVAPHLGDLYKEIGEFKIWKLKP